MGSDGGLHAFLLAGAALDCLLLLFVQLPFELQYLFLEFAFLEVELHDHCAAAATARHNSKYKASTTIGR